MRRNLFSQFIRADHIRAQGAELFPAGSQATRTPPGADTDLPEVAAVGRLGRRKVLFAEVRVPLRLRIERTVGPEQLAQLHGELDVGPAIDLALGLEETAVLLDKPVGGGERVSHWIA